ncbi:MAG: TolC family protein [Pirellulaceae bacterium]
MKRLAMPLLLLALIAVGGSQLPHLAAQAPPPPNPPSPPSLPSADAFTAPLQANPNMMAIPAQPVLSPYGTPEWRPPDPRIRELTERYNELEQQVLTERYNELEQQVMRTAQEFRQMHPEGQERDNLRQKIAELTQEQFQVRHQARQFEIEHLQNQLKELQEKLQRREERKDEIIERRVAQLTDQDQELRWEPLTPPGALTGGTPIWMPGPSDMSNLPGRPGAYVPGTSYATRSPMARPAEAYGRLPSYNPMAPAQSPAIAPPLSALPASRPMASPPQSVREAEARLEIAQRDLKRIKAQFDEGIIPSRELNQAEDAVQLAQITLQDAQLNHEARIKMLELDLRKTQAEFEAVRAELEALTQAHVADGSVSQAALRKAKAALVEKEVELERAKTMLELQQQHDQKSETTPGR